MLQAMRPVLARISTLSESVILLLSDPLLLFVILNDGDTIKCQVANNGYQGIFYFLSHRSLWKPLISKLAPTITLGLGVTTFMFLFTYVPQAAVMAFTSGPLAAISAAVLVLSESSTIFTVLSKNFLIEDALLDTFDGVLVSKNTTDLVSGGRQIKAGGDPMAKLGKMIKKPFAKFTPNALIKYFMYLPLNFIPVVGTVAFVVLQGKRAGPAAHTRYFQLKEWNNSQRQKHIEEHQAAYTRYENIYFLPPMFDC